MRGVLISQVHEEFIWRQRKITKEFQLAQYSRTRRGAVIRERNILPAWVRSDVLDGLLCFFWRSPDCEACVVTSQVVRRSYVFETVVVLARNRYAEQFFGSC